MRGKFPGSELQSVRAGLGGAEAEGLRLFLPDGAEISLKSAKIKYSLAGLLSKNADIESAQIEGLLVKLAAGKAGNAPAQEIRKPAQAAAQNQPTAKRAPEGGKENSPSALQTLSEWGFTLGSLKADAAVLGAGTAPKFPPNSPSRISKSRRA